MSKHQGKILSSGSLADDDPIKTHTNTCIVLAEKNMLERLHDAINDVNTDFFEVEEDK